MKKKRRARGEGSVFKIPRSRFWRLAYTNLDGARVEESSGKETKTDALGVLRERLLTINGGAVAIPRVEQTTFNEAAQSLIDSYTNSGKKSLDDLTRRIELHLKPYFGGRRLISIGAAEARAYTKHRLAEKVVERKARLDKDGKIVEPEITRTTSPAQVNRELAILKQIFTLAVRDRKIGNRPHIEMLRENNVRQGFFEREQIDGVIAHLPAELRPVISFAYVTGWRLASEVFPLEWRNVDLKAGEVRLDAGSTKNDEGRVFYITTELRRVLEEQHAAHERMKKAGTICPHVFFRMVAHERGGEKKPEPIISITKAWRNACRDAGVPGRIPHDLRRTAVRNLVRSGVSESVAMKLTGHKTRSVFERYNITSADDLRQAAGKLDAFAGMSSPSTSRRSTRRGGRTA